MDVAAGVRERVQLVPSALSGRAGGKGAAAAAVAVPQASGRSGTIALVAVLVATLIVGLVRYRLADTPFERDEGEYAYAGQLILHGMPPYQHAYNMKFPGTYYAYALSEAAFGQTIRAIRLGLILVTSASTLLVFLIGRRLLGPRGGAFAAIAFAFLSLDRWVLGPFAHATHYVLLPALAGFWLLLRPPGRGRALIMLVSGVLLGVAVLMKQHAVFFLPLAAYLVLGGGAGANEANAAPESTPSWSRRFADLALLTLGSALPLAVLIVVFTKQGVLHAFWFWTIQYARQYVSEMPPDRILFQFWASFRQTLLALPPLWAAAGVGLVTLWLPPWTRTVRVFLAGLALASFLAICPGFYFRGHYFILMLPAVALLAAVAVESLRAWLARRAPPTVANVTALLAYGLILLVPLAAESEFLFAMTPRTLSRSVYGGEPFIEAVEIARYIREHSAPGDRIAVLGSEPEIYYYAQRLSATGYIYTYPLMETQPFAAHMQDEMIREVEAAQPKFMVFVQVTTSWMVSPTSDKRILEWGFRYANDHYRQVGAADILSFEETRYLWGDAAAGYKPQSQAAVFVYERKDAS